MFVLLDFNDLSTVEALKVLHDERSILYLDKSLWAKCVASCLDNKK